MTKRVVIVIPTAETPSWEFQRHLPKDVPVIVVDGSGGKLSLDKKRYDIYGFDRQKKILGSLYKSFRMFQGASACRNFGHFLALKQGFEIIIALDYDCIVPHDFIKKHVDALKLRTISVVYSENGWINPIAPTGWYSRGYPYEKRYPTKVTQKREQVRVGFNMGLWENVVDINGIDKVLKKPPTKLNYSPARVGAGSMLPISGMNNAFLSELVFAYLLLPNVLIQGWELSRHDDIWGGYILKRILDKKKVAVSFGEPVIYHAKESWQPRVLAHEHYLHLMSEKFYRLVDEAMTHVEVDTYQNMFAQFVRYFKVEINKSREQHLPPHYYDAFIYLERGMQWWVNLCQKL